MFDLNPFSRYVILFLAFFKSYFLFAQKSDEKWAKIQLGGNTPYGGVIIDQRYYLDSLHKKSLDFGLGFAVYKGTSSVNNLVTPLVHSLAFNRNFKGLVVFSGYSGAFVGKRARIISWPFVPSLYAGARFEIYKSFQLGFNINKFVFVKNSFYTDNNQILKERTLRTFSLLGVHLGFKIK